MMEELEFGGYRWQSLATYSRIDKLSQELNTRLVKQWLSPHGQVEAELDRRVQNERRGKGLTFVISTTTNQPLGFAGLLTYRGVKGSLQTTTYLCPTCWGSDLNFLCKIFIWQLAYDTLNIDSYYSSIDKNNTRSKLAIMKLYPMVKPRLVNEFWRSRQAWLFKIDGPPKQWPGRNESLAVNLAKIDFVQAFKKLSIKS